MSPEERLRALRDDERWVDEPFVLRPRRRPVAARITVAALVLAAVVAGLVVLALPRVPAPSAPVAAPTPSAVPWIPARGAGPLGTADRPVLPVTVGIEAPKRAVAGRVLDYTVVLTNPTSRAVPLTPCPTYTQSVTPTEGPPLLGRYLLNCSPVGVLQPGASARFAMRQPVPAAAGAATLRWTLTGGPAATADLTIEEPR